MHLLILSAYTCFKWGHDCKISDSQLNNIEIKTHHEQDWFYDAY